MLQTTSAPCSFFNSSQYFSKPINTRVLIAESPIDTMSLAMLDCRERKSRAGKSHDRKIQGATIYLSVDGAGAMPLEALRALLSRCTRVVAAFDADKVGEIMAWRAAQALPSIERLRPQKGKDWNEQLILKKGGAAVDKSGVLSRDDCARLGQLWQWLEIAKKAGRNERYLQRIAEVVR